MTTIYNLDEMVLFQKTVLDELNLNLKLQKLKLEFITNNTLTNFINLFNYIKCKIKCKTKKIRSSSKLISFNITFNFTNDNGVVLYNNLITIKRCKNINYYSKMTNEKIGLLYDRVLNNIKFNNNIQNTLVNKALENRKEWAYNIVDNIYYGCKFTHGTGGYSANDSPYTIVYDDGTETQATINVDYSVLPDTSNKGSCVYITNSIHNYRVIFNIYGLVDFYCCGAGGGGGLGAICPIDQNNEYIYKYTGGGGGGAGGNVIKKSATISSINTVFFVKIGKGGIGAINNGTIATKGGSTTITGYATTITATGGGSGGNGTIKIEGGGTGGINEMPKPTGYGAVGGYNEYYYNTDDKGPSNGQWGYNINISIPNIYVSGGGSGGSGASYFDEIANGSGEGGTGGLGGGGGAGGGITNTEKAGGLGGYLNTNHDPDKHGVNGTKSFITNDPQNGTDDDGINYIITPGNGSNGIYCGGGGGSGSAIGIYHGPKTSKNYRTTKSTDIRGGNGGDGLVCFRTPR